MCVLASSSSVLMNLALPFIGLTLPFRLENVASLLTVGSSSIRSEEKKKKASHLLMQVTGSIPHGGPIESMFCSSSSIRSEEKRHHSVIQAALRCDRSVDRSLMVDLLNICYVLVAQYALKKKLKGSHLLMV